jgi:succinoglycan biosynthesis transport protein ExoP
MTLQQFFLILRANYAVALATLIILAGATLAVSMLTPKQYVATAAVVIDVKSPDQISGQMLQGMMAPGYMATQIDIINSDRVAKEVVKLMRLDKNAEMQTQWQLATKGQGDLTDWLSGRLLKSLEVSPSRESNVISIKFTSENPKLAAATANAFAQAYINVNLDLRLAPARQYATFFEEQTKDARAKLEAAQTALSQYQQANGITSSDDALDFETAKLNETSAQLTAVQGQTTDSQSKRLTGKADTLPEVMQSSLINGLKTEISRLEVKLRETSVNLGRNHPQITGYEAELFALKAQLDTEVRRIASSIETSYQVGKEREARLQGALAAQKARVLLLNKQRDELKVMRRDVESAQRTFESVSQRASQTSMESRVNQTNIAVLNPATVPTVPTKPRVTFNVAMAVFFGTLLGVGLAIGLELLNRRVRSPRDLSDALGIPLLGAIGHVGAKA